MSGDGKIISDEVQIDPLVTENAPEAKTDDVGGVDQEKIIANLSRAGKIIKWLLIGTVVVPFCAAMAVSMFRNIESVALQAQASENAKYMGEFDPTMGEKISSENGRALVVVHEGFGQEVWPMKYENNEEYQEYLRRVEAEKQLFYENGDPVVIVVTGLSLARGDVVLEPRPNTLYYVTQENNGFGAISFTTDGKTYKQSMKSGGVSDFVPEGMGPWEILKAAGVTDVVMAGEFRGACPSQVAGGIEDHGLGIWWSDVAAYPIADTPELLEAYPTIEPLP